MQDLGRRRDRRANLMVPATSGSSVLVNRPSYSLMKDYLRPYYKKENIGDIDFDMFTINRGRLTVQEPMAQVFYNIDYLRRHWGRMMNILSVTKEAYWEQTAIVFGK